MTKFQDTAHALANGIPDGCLLALPPDYSFVPMELVRALIRRRLEDASLLAVPIGGMAVDLLVGAGCVRAVEAAAVSLGEQGRAPRFAAAVKDGAVHMRDSTCPAVHTALQAAEKGVPFMPLRGLIGSDLLSHRDDWRVVDDPLGDDDGPIVLLPAIRPDVAILHAPKADRHGNLWIGRRRELLTMAHAASTTLATVETVVEDDLLADPVTAAGCIPGLYVDAIAEAPNGAWPVGLPEFYPPDTAHLKAYAEAAATEAGFQDYLARWVLAAEPVA